MVESHTVNHSLKVRTDLRRMLSFELGLSRPPRRRGGLCWKLGNGAFSVYTYLFLYVCCVVSSRVAPVSITCVNWMLWVKECSAHTQADMYCPTSAYVSRPSWVYVSHIVLRVSSFHPFFCLHLEFFRYPICLRVLSCSLKNKEEYNFQ
ncbi:hypothetical protein, unlikely [Trypanosoma brucei gambiense DAL972]|uniref:Uncharacterized protein n=1 Tax=Trypanosoma brucei gambiense (strain MHOM/CI/86/DAL972) TaxID=679716 RepID=D0A9N8_TRYB9|nr:hypothetical protein, unlikely [Trypanosoma brucei gambiense DAL972]CBH18389.1 hypothetical protein, unlikely [Trypanosoma brucei gambiense DAL972]|eukprot:XP_011780653.1 hypothetical protein, unlikely [Trypanosoma brucei gambiense DAL972]